jgi:hypothetical protein
MIDGVSGIAGSAVFIMLSGLVFLAGQPGDAMVVHLPLAGIGATLGVLSVELRNQPPVQHLPQEDCPQNWREQAGPAASSRAFFQCLAFHLHQQDKDLPSIRNAAVACFIAAWIPMMTSPAT